MVDVVVVEVVVVGMVVVVVGIVVVVVGGGIPTWSIALVTSPNCFVHGSLQWNTEY